MSTAPIVTFSASSSASSAPSTSTSAANSTSTDSGGGGGGGEPSTSSATLYLYTFLATLVLLLAVSAAIVVRSYLIRQRQRRLLDDAVRDGLLVPAFTGGAGFGRAALARKPELVDVYLGSAPAEKGRRRSASASGSVGGGGGWWNAVMPVAAREVQEGPTPQGKSKSSYPPSISRTPPPPSTFARLRQALRIAMPVPSVGAGVLPAPATARHPETVELATTVPTTPDRSAPPARRSLDVGFLIAMPAPPVAHHEVGYLPYVEFGITRVGAAADRESEGLRP